MIWICALTLISAKRLVQTENGGLFEPVAAFGEDLRPGARMASVCAESGAVGGA
jgi:hypothetical protein